MSQVIAIKQVPLRVFCKAPHRYLKQLPIILHTKESKFTLSADNADKPVDGALMPKRAEVLPTKNRMSSNIDMPTKYHACGCKVKESKLCKEHGRF